jgi:hypothetical protein
VSLLFSCQLGNSFDGAWCDITHHYEAGCSSRMMGNLRGAGVISNAPTPHRRNLDRRPTLLIVREEAMREIIPTSLVFPFFGEHQGEIFLLHQRITAIMGTDWEGCYIASSIRLSTMTLRDDAPS